MIKFLNKIIQSFRRQASAPFRSGVLSPQQLKYNFFRRVASQRGHGQDGGSAEVRVAAQAIDEAEAVDDGHAKVAQDEVRLHPGDDAQGLAAGLIVNPGSWRQDCFELYAKSNFI